MKSSFFRSFNDSSRSVVHLYRLLSVFSLFHSSSSFLLTCTRRSSPLLSTVPSSFTISTQRRRRSKVIINGWVQDDSGEWQWEDDDAGAATSTSVATIATNNKETTLVDQVQNVGATPKLPSGSFRPKQSLGQNFLRDANTVQKIVRYYAQDAEKTFEHQNEDQIKIRPIELGPGAGALTESLLKLFSDREDSTPLRVIEIDPRSVDLLSEKHPELKIDHLDVLQADYNEIAKEEGGPLSIIGNLPYYITSQILFALADASHFGSVKSATVTMQYEVAERLIAKPKTKEYGILSVVFQMYSQSLKLHFKIPPTVFYPKPKVDSALVGVQFIKPHLLRERLAGVNPRHIRKVLSFIYQQRRKTIRNSLKKLLQNELSSSELSDTEKKEKMNEILDSAPLPLPQIVLDKQKEGDLFASSQELPPKWNKMRPEELTPGQVVELTRLIYGPNEYSGEQVDKFDKKVWRKMKHGSN